MTCLITGTLVDPTGTALPNTELVITTRSRVAGIGGQVFIPEDVRVTSDAAGTVSFNLFPTTYRGEVVASENQSFIFTFTVPDEATAVLADLVGQIAPVTPSVLSQAVAAKNEAVDAAAQADASAADAGEFAITASSASVSANLSATNAADSASSAATSSGLAVAASAQAQDAAAASQASRLASDASAVSAASSQAASQTSANTAASAADSAQRWAESATSPDGTSSKSAKTWAGEAEASADRVDLGALDAAVAQTDADRVQTGLDRTATGVDAAAAAAARIAAETARDGAFVNAAVYASTTAAQGDTGLAVGAQYQVVVGSEIVRYRKDSGSASTELARYATAAATQEARRSVGLPVTGTSVIPASGSVNPSVSRSFTPTVGVQYTMRARFHLSGIRYVQLICTGFAQFNAVFDCVTLAVTATVGTASVRDVGGGWYEFSATSTAASAATSSTFQLRLSQTGLWPYTANGTDLKIVDRLELFAVGTTTNLFTATDPANAAFTKTSCTTGTTTTPEALPWPGIAATSALASTVNTQLNSALIACRLTEASGTTNSRIFRSLVATSGTTYRLVIEAKRGSRKWLRALCSANVLFSFAVNLETGESLRVADALFAPAAISTSYLPGGFWRIDISVAATSSGSANINLIVLDDSLTWPNRTGDGTSGLILNSAELFANGVSAWRTTDFTDAAWTKEGITVTPNAETFGGIANEIRYTPGLVDINGRTWSSVPNAGDGTYGPGKVTLNGMPYFIPGPAKKPDLHGALRAALAYEIANSVPIAFMGDSITWSTSEFDRRRNMVDMFTSFVNQGSPGDEPVLHAVANYLLITHGITVTGSTTNGTTGPVGESLIMAAGSVLTFTGTYSQVDVFYNQAAGAGSLAFAFNGTTYKTVNCAGASELDRYSGPSATGQTASGTYTITCSGGPVEITGIDRLGIKAAGTLPRVRTFRWAHGSWNFSHFGPAQIASLVKQSSAFSAIPPTVVAPLGVNERQAVGTSGINTMKTRFQTLLNDMLAGGLPRVTSGMARTIWQMPVRTSAAADAGFYASALPYDQLVGGMAEILGANSIPSIGTHALNLSVAGKMDADGIHPTEAGLYDMTQMMIEGICRIRGVLS